jgi:hypothetical protein
VYEIHQPYSLTSVSSIHLSPPISTPHCTYFTILSFIFNSKVSVSKYFSMYPSCEYTVLWSVQPLPLLSLSLPAPIINQFSVHIVLSSTCTDAVCFDIVDSLSLSFPFPLLSEFHRVLPLLQICFIYKWIYDHVWFCVYIYLLDLYSTSERKHVTLSFWT